MPGQRIGYVRVSSIDQNPERQLETVAPDNAIGINLFSSWRRGVHQNGSTPVANETKDGIIGRPSDRITPAL